MNFPGKKTIIAGAAALAIGGCTHTNNLNNNHPNIITEVIDHENGTIIRILDGFADCGESSESGEYPKDFLQELLEEDGQDPSILDYEDPKLQTCTLEMDI